MDDRTFVTVEEEMTYLQSYISIQKFRYTDKFIVLISLEDGIERIMTPKMLLQPLVENALLHGISPLKTKGVIQIKLFTEDNRLKMRVQDNGVGMNPAQLEAALNRSPQPGQGHIGLSNVASRIRSIFGESGGMNAWSEEQRFTTVELSIPIMSAEEVRRYD